MNRREIVLRAIERRSPPRVPLHYGNRDFEYSDTVGVGFGSPEGYVPPTPETSEWGFIWERLDGTMGQPIAPPLGNWGNLARYTPPDPAAPGRLAGLDKAIAAADGKLVKFGLGITGFNQATFLRGFESFLEDLYLDRGRAEQVLDLVVDFESEMIRRGCTHAIDVVSFGDDWGTQNGLILSPDLWREVFRPRYEKQFAIAHKAGKKVWFHSCGDVSSIIGDMIDIGVDVLELLQPDLLGVRWLSREFGGRVCFCCSVDHQRVAISGSREELFAYTRMLRDELGKFDGGFIAYIEDYACLGMSEQNYQWIRQAFQGL